MSLSHITEFHRPAQLAEALRLLRAGAGRTLPLAGGTDLLGHPPPGVEALVDLSALGLDKIETEGGGALLLGALATLATLATHQAVRRYGGALLAESAQRTAGSLLRERATLGGTLLSRAGQSELAALLLAAGAEAQLADEGGTRTLPLAALLAERATALPPGTLLVALRLPPLAEGERLCREWIARTPKDQPILVVAARLGPQGATVAVSGIGPTPATFTLPRAADDAALRAQTEALAVQGDPRASADYRRAMLPVLLRRLLAQSA